MLTRTGIRQNRWSRSDLWALGCTLFEIRTGRKLFDTFDGDVDDHIYMMVLILGKLPEPWWSAWEAHKDAFQEEADSEGRARKINELKEETLSPTDQAAYSDIPDPRSIRDALAGGLVGTDYGSGTIRQPMLWNRRHNEFFEWIQPCRP
jgi:serine/threonine protein kinase